MVDLKTKKKAAGAVKTVDLTVKEFQRVMGLGSEVKSYIAATVMLKMLVDRGVAEEVARLHTGAGRLGRKSVIYRMPVEFTLKAKPRASEAA
jgi:hypothetical protein